MTTIDESRTAKGFTPAALVPAAFGQARRIDGIVIHHWGLTGQTHDGVVNFFCSTGPGETSAHFVVSAGRISCIVSPDDAAWHCPGKNATTIGIECRPEATDADYATVAELIRYLRGQYGNLPLSRHRDWYATACPGIWDLARLDRLASGSAAIAPQSATITEAEEDMTPEERKTLFEVLDKINGNVDALPDAQYWADLINATARIDAGTANAPQLAAQINAAGLAESVRDELVKLIGGSK